jgi:biotin carboxyl carrier protein
VTTAREFYWVRRGLAQTKRVEMIAGAIAMMRQRKAVAEHRLGTGDDRGISDRLLGQIASRIKEDDRPEFLGGQFAQALKQLVGPVEVELFRVDPFNQQLIRGYAPGNDRDVYRQTGLLGYAIRTNKAEVFRDCENDPRFDPEVDGAHQAIERHAIVVPMHDLYGETRLLVCVSAPARLWPNPENDLPKMERFIKAAEAFFLRHLFQDTQNMENKSGLTAEGKRQQTGLFREEAIQAQAQSTLADPAVLEAGAGWTRHTYRLISAATVLMLLAGLLVQINQYASGWGVVRTGQSTPLRATLDGNIDVLHAQSGSEVKAGQLLLELSAQAERQALHQAEERFHEAVRQRLLDPNDGNIASQLPNLRAGVQTTRDALRLRQVFSPLAGRIGDVRLESGQYIVAGQHLFDITQQGAKQRVIALVPGSFRPRLAVGQNMRVSLAGYAFTTLTLKVTRIGTELVGPSEAKRMLGAAREDAFPVSGSNVWVEADLEQSSFDFNGRALRFHDGLSGEVEIVIDRAPLLLQFGSGASAWR